jgi:hypothetical protein
MGKKKDKKPDKEIKFLKLNPGDTYKGEVILDIFFVTNKYIIYTTDKSPNKISYYYTEKQCGQNLSKIQGDLLRLIDALRVNEEVENNCYYLGAIYAVCFDGNIDSAKDLIESLYADTFMGQKIRKKGKINYLSCCLGITLIAIAAAVVLQYLLDDKYKDLLRYFKIATFGSIGGFISVTIKISNTRYNFDKDSKVQVLSAISRIFISIFSAIAIYTIIKSDFLFGFLKNFTDHLFYSFGILAGFSETFIPDVFGIVEKQTINKLNKPSGN